MNVQSRRSKLAKVTRVSVRVRNEVVARIVAREKTSSQSILNALMFVGDGGVSSHEFGEVLGVCSEAPLPMISIVRRELLLDGVCGMADMLRHWGMSARVVCPMGRRRFASLHKKLLRANAISAIELIVPNHQHFKYTQRVYADGHQLTHIETVENIYPAFASTASRCLDRIAKSAASASLLCVVDGGSAGIDAECFKQLVDCAKIHKVPVFYEPRTPRMLACDCVDIVKLNYNQMRAWYGRDVSRENDALRAARALLNESGAQTVFYTRGDRGMVVCERHFGSSRAVVVEPNEKNMFDAVAAGDIVTAALAFCLARRYSPMEAACFAAAAAERALERRGSKRIAMSELI